MKDIVRACLAGVVALAFSGNALAQDSESARVAKQLAAALDAAKVDSIAAKDPTRAGTYVAALYFSGTQLLVISAQYSAPTLLDQKLLKKEYRDIYLDLYGAPMPGTKVFIEDFGADGFKVQAGRATRRPTATRRVENERRSTAIGTRRSCRRASISRRSPPPGAPIPRC